MSGKERLRRYAKTGMIEAPQRYIDYSGQVIVRERYSTYQRWIKEGWDGGIKRLAPYILGRTYCRRSDVLDPMNDHLDEDELEIYYVEDRDKVVYKVEETTAIATTGSEQEADQ